MFEEAYKELLVKYHEERDHVEKEKMRRNEAAEVGLFSLRTFLSLNEVGQGYLYRINRAVNKTKDVEKVLAEERKLRMHEKVG